MLVSGVSGAAPVVQLHEYADAIVLPALSLTPVVIVAVYVVLYERLDDGVNVAVVPE